MTEIKYGHRLDGQGNCNCLGFSMDPKDPGFPAAAADHFITTTGDAVRAQTGWRGFFRRIQKFFLRFRKDPNRPIWWWDD